MNEIQIRTYLKRSSIVLIVLLISSFIVVMLPNKCDAQTAIGGIYEGCLTYLDQYEIGLIIIFALLLGSIICAGANPKTRIAWTLLMAFFAGAVTMATLGQYEVRFSVIFAPVMLLAAMGLLIKGVFKLIRGASTSESEKAGVSRKEGEKKENIREKITFQRVLTWFRIIISAAVFIFIAYKADISLGFFAGITVFILLFIFEKWLKTIFIISIIILIVIGFFYVSGKIDSSSSKSKIPAETIGNQKYSAVNTVAEAKTQIDVIVKAGQSETDPKIRGKLLNRMKLLRGAFVKK